MQAQTRFLKIDRMMFKPILRDAGGHAMAIYVGILSNDRLRREHERPEVGTLDDAECARAQTHKHSSGTSRCTDLCAGTCHMDISNTFRHILQQTSIF